MKCKYNPYVYLVIDLSAHVCVCVCVVPKEEGNSSFSN